MSEETIIIKTAQDQVNSLILRHSPNVDLMMQEARDAVVVDLKDVEMAQTAAIPARNLAKKLEEAKKTITDPYKRFLNAVNDVARQLTDKLKTVENTYASKMDAWKSQERKAIAEQQQIAAELQDTLGIAVVPVVETNVSTIRSSGAMSYEQEQWNFEIQDFNAIPREMLMVNEAKIKSLVRAGVRDIPGVRIYKTKKTIIKTR